MPDLSSRLCNQAAAIVERMSAKTIRAYLGVSQSRLARLSGVSRFKICTSELGDKPLTIEEASRIRAALQAEAERLCNLSKRLELEQHKSADRLLEGG